MSVDPHTAGLPGTIVHDEIVPSRAPWLHHVAAGQTLYRVRWEATADALVDLVRTHELEGINFDLEPHGSVAADAERYARFLSRVKPRLNAAGAR